LDEPSPSPPELQYQPPPMMLPPRRRGGISPNTLVLLVGLFIGVLIFAGTLSFHATLLIPVPCTSCSPTTDPALIAYRDTVRILAWVSVVTMDLAVSFSVAMAWIAGGSRGELSDGTRRGIFLFATVFLVVWLVFSWVQYVLFRGIISIP
jgi:hypothetical protein